MLKRFLRPWDMAARRPISLAVGEFRPGAHQPIWFSDPKLLMDTHKVQAGGTALDGLAMYASLTEREGRRPHGHPGSKSFQSGPEPHKD